MYPLQNAFNQQQAYGQQSQQGQQQAYGQHSQQGLQSGQSQQGMQSQYGQGMQNQQSQYGQSMQNQQSQYGQGQGLQSGQYGQALYSGSQAPYSGGQELNRYQGQGQPYGLQSYSAMGSMPGQQQQQSMYGGQQLGMQGWQQGSLSEQDYGHFVLNELKRVTREYVTAALESANPQIRQTFQSLALKSLDDQEKLFQVLQQAHGYGDIPQAQQQDVQRELQQMSQKASKLQSLLEQTIGGQHSLFQEQWQSQGAGQQPGAGYMMAGSGSQTEQGAFAPGAAYGSAMDHAGAAAQSSAGYAGSKSAKESANVFAANSGTGQGNTGAGGGAYRGTQQSGSQPGSVQQGNTQATSYLM